MRRIKIVLKPLPDQQAALEQFLDEQQNIGSPNYHNWLTPEQYADRFGLNTADIAKMASWLQSQGLSVDSVSRARNWIAFSGTASQVASALLTDIRQYRMDGGMHFANASDPSIPEAFAPVVLGFLGLDDFPSKSGLVRTLSRDTAHLTLTSYGEHLAPDDLATIYSITPIYQNGIDGTGQTIVIVGESNVHLSDISNFRSVFNLPNSPTSTPVILTPTQADPGFNQDELEADLDLEWAGAVARNAQLIYMYEPSYFTAVHEAVNNNQATIISASYNDCEPLTSPALANIMRATAQQANAQGITWVASSGDSGAAACDADGQTTHPAATGGLAVNLPASIPEVTGVGGTEFNEGAGAGMYWAPSNGPNYGSATTYIPEKAWNDSNGALAASGGGMSVLYTLKPVWQIGPGVPADGVRDVPDVSLSASAVHDGYVICSAGNCANGLPTMDIETKTGNAVVGGTSASAPVFAGMIALLEHYLVKNSLRTSPRLGNINPALYRLAQSSFSVFHDVPSGSNNIVPCVIGTPDCTTGSFGYETGPGYDLVTGLGSVNANNLLTHWSSSACTYSLSGPASEEVLAIAANFSTTLTTQSTCPWTAYSNSTWLKIMSTASGAGSAVINSSASANSNSALKRTATLYVGGQTFVLTQLPSIGPDLVITSLTAPFRQVLVRRST